MFKKRVLLLLLISFLVIFILKFKLLKNAPAQKEKPSSIQKEALEKDRPWLVWEDAAGFSFEYPDGVEIDSHPEDQINYASLTLFAPDRSGEINILCNDTDYLSLEEWRKNNKELGQANSLETKIASASALKFSLGENKEITAFIDQDKVLYTISYQAKDNSFWYPIYKHLLGSFKLIPLAGESEADFQNWLEGFNTEQADIVEPVEIIE